MYESEEVSGKLTEAAAERWVCPTGMPVVGGGGDQAAGAVGNGIVRKGVISATMGTSGVVFAHSDEVQIDPAGRVHTFCHAVRGKWHVMGVVLSAGGSLQWYRNQLGAGGDRTPPDAMGVDPYDLHHRRSRRRSRPAAKVSISCRTSPASGRPMPTRTRGRHGSA